jgi:hypothetical protein
MAALDYYYEEHGFILAVSPGWEFEVYGFYPNGIGDTIFRTLHFAISEGKYSLFMNGAELLTQRKRWSDELGIGNEKKFAKNWLQWRWSKWLHKHGERQHRLYRSQKGMTRDPYIMFYCAAYILNRTQFISAIKPPWYIWRPGFNNWRRYLITGNRFWKWWYETTEMIGMLFNPPMYALYLSAWKAYVADSSKVKRMISRRTPTWNYAIRQLIHHPLRHHDTPFIERYQPRFGFIWQDNEWNKNFIKDPSSEARHMDKDILLFLHSRNETYFSGKRGWDMNKKLWWEQILNVLNWRKYGVQIKFVGMDIVLHAEHKRPKFYTK